MEAVLGLSGGLRRARSSRFSMACQRLASWLEQDCRALLTSGLQQWLVPYGDHLTMTSPNRMVRLASEIGWCPEVA